MDGIDPNQLWNEVLESIKVSVSPANYQTWFLQTHLAKIDKNGERYLVEVGCSSSFVKGTLEMRYFGVIQDTLSKALQNSCDLLFTVKSKPKLLKENPPAISPLFDRPTVDMNEIQEKARNFGLRLSYTFDNFAVSSSNQMAWAAAEAVSKNPGTAYNPLFIWGGVGVGKTHLMTAVGHYLLREDIKTKVVCCTGEDFTNDIVDGIRNKTTQAVRNKYRKLTILLIDDIQFIAGKEAVQEEFFHTFNTLVRSGSQIIMTSDRPPSEISKLEERLRSRFEAGLIVDIAPPDFELRCAILQIKTQERNLDIDMDLIQLIAANIDTARKLEGFLVKLTSEARSQNRMIDREMIERLISKGVDSVNNITKKIDPNAVINAVAKYYSLGKRSLLGDSRARPIAQPRQILMYLLRTTLGLPLQEVGRLVGGRDHTTVMHAVDKITNLNSSSVDIRQDIQGIKNFL